MALRTTSATANLETFAFSARTGQVWDLKLAVERITGVPPFRQSLEYEGQPVENLFRDVLHKPLSQYGPIDGVLLRDVIRRDPQEASGGSEEANEKGRVDPELRACCAEMPYKLFVRFYKDSPPHSANSNYIGAQISPPPSSSLPPHQEWLFFPVRHGRTIQWREKAPETRQQQQHCHFSCTGHGKQSVQLKQQQQKNYHRHFSCCTDHEQSVQLKQQQQTHYCQQHQHQHNAQQRSVHLPLPKKNRRKKKQQQVDVIEIVDSDSDSSKEGRNDASRSAMKQEDEDSSRKQAVRKDSDAAKLPDPKRRRIKIKNVGAIMKNSKPDSCGSTHPYCSQPALQREDNVDSVTTGKRNPTTHTSSGRVGNARQHYATSGISRGSVSTTPSNALQQKRAALPTSVPASDEGHVKRSLDPHPSPASSSSSSGVPSSTSRLHRSTPPPCRPPPPIDIHLWLRDLDAEDGGRGGRILRHAGAFVREFPCLEDVASACDMEGPDRVLDACCVMAMGERACLKRAMRALPRLGGA